MVAVKKEMDREEKLELIESLVHCLLECMHGADLIGHMEEIPITGVPHALVLTDAMAEVASRIEHNALTALQETLIEYQDWEELKEYKGYLREKCRFNPINSDRMPEEFKRGAQEDRKKQGETSFLKKDFPSLDYIVKALEEGQYNTAMGAMKELTKEIEKKGNGNGKTEEGVSHD